MTKFNAKEILAQLDACAAVFNFPTLDNGYVYLAGVRLTAFRDDARWAIVVETVGVDARDGGHGGINICLYRFGNCLTQEVGIGDFVFLSGDAPGEPPCFADKFGEEIAPDTRHILIRGASLPIPRYASDFDAAGVKLSAPPRVFAFELVRVLVPSGRRLFLATDEELRKHLPSGIPGFLELDEWFHPDVSMGERPSGCESLQLLAEALESGDPTRYRPTRAPNTHWRHWPAGGTL